ncbi:MAG: molecular chaperone TorD family protein [Acidobacteriota bacterium]
MARHRNQNSQISTNNSKTVWQTESQEESIAIAHGRECCYQLLSRIFQREIDLELICSLINGSANPIALTLGLEPYLLTKLGDEASILDALAVDYCQLFIGPVGHHPPCQSIWTGEPQLWGQTTVEVNNLLRRLRLRIPDSSTDQPDHIWVIFSLMAHLADTEATALTHNDHSLVTALRELERHCLQRHIVGWVNRLCKWMEIAAKELFYKRLAASTISFISSEKKFLGRERKKMLPS